MKAFGFLSIIKTLLRSNVAGGKEHAAMCKIDQNHSGIACAAPSDVMERAIGQAAARISDVGPSNQIDGRTNWSRSISDQRFSSPALTAMPVPQVGWCCILLRS